jgi:hypothetical protein
MNVLCPSCSAPVSVPDAEATPFTKLRCGECDREFTVSEAGDADAEPAPKLGSSEASAMYALSALTELARAQPEPAAIDELLPKPNASGVVDFAMLKQSMESGGDAAAAQPPPVFLPGPLGGLPPEAVAEPKAEPKPSSKGGIVIASVLVVVAAAAAGAVVKARSAVTPPTAVSALPEASAQPSAAASVAAVLSATTAPSASAAGSAAPRTVKVAGPLPARSAAATAAAVDAGAAPAPEPTPEPPPPPPPPPAGKCAQCAPGDLMCNMACASGAKPK